MLVRSLLYRPRQWVLNFSLDQRVLKGETLPCPNLSMTSSLTFPSKYIVFLFILSTLPIELLAHTLTIAHETVMKAYVCLYNSVLLQMYVNLYMNLHG
jgi:hypothetical protein